MTERSAKVVPFAASATLPMRNPRDKIRTVEELAAIAPA